MCETDAPKKESTVAAMARGVSSELLRGVDAGLDAGGERLTRRLDAQVDRLLARGFALLLLGLAAGWLSYAIFAGVTMVAPAWIAALVSAGGLTLAAVLCHAVFSTAARDRERNQ